MGDGNGGRAGRSEAEELILRTIAAHADSLLRTARRHSLCVDDAQDAYQRGLEIFMRHAERLDPPRAAAWLHTVVKREAKAIRRSRQRLVGSSSVDLDAHECQSVPTPEEQLLSFDMVNRSAEALQRLKPQELRALWLKAQGHSYSDIGAITGWSYTKVNRCITEGRRSFLERYAGIESGDECARWTPILSAMADGEATPDQIVELRPHLRNCPGCRGRLKAMQDSSEPLAAVLPVPLAIVAAAPGEQVSNVILRIYEAIAGGLHERAVHGATKAQAAIEAASAGKVAAVAASAAAMAGGGYVSVVERPERPAPEASRVTSQPRASDRSTRAAETAAGLPASPRRAMPPPSARIERTEFGSRSSNRRRAVAPEFQPTVSAAGHNAIQGSARAAKPSTPPATSSTPEFAPAPGRATASEFGP